MQAVHCSVRASLRGALLMMSLSGVVLAVGCARGGAGGGDLPVNQHHDPSTDNDGGEADTGMPPLLDDGADGEEDAGMLPEPDAGHVAMDAGAQDASAPDAGEQDAGVDESQCQATTTCALPSDLGHISGDTGSATFTAMGARSTFYSLRVTEDDSGFLSPKSLSVSATLTTPGADFDLYLYASGNGCDSLTAASEQPFTDSVSTSWPDEQSIGGHDDARTVILEVRHKDGACDPTSPFTLSVRGH
jgi:hypothetical protein